MKTQIKAGMVSALVLSSLSPLVAQRQGFTYDMLLERRDENNDGNLSEGELARNQQMFRTMDRDKDGTVTREEFDAAKKSRSKQQGQASRYEEGRNKYAKQGLQAGQKVPELEVYDLQGNKKPLSNLWKNKLAVLVTASATCPISVRTCPSLKPLSVATANEANIGILYVKEAHPAEGETPPAGRKLGTRAHPQPNTFKEKLELARLFDEEIDHGSVIYVDNLEKTAATALGVGPNIGLLINTDGTVVLRQGWYDAKEMEAAVKKLKGKPSKPRKQSRNRQLPENITVHRDLEYAVEGGESLGLDLYLPEKAGKAPPLMVWIHGGGWKNGDKANVNPAILRLSGEGYAVASINYRLKDLSIHPKNIHDCKGAVRWLRA
ncbi:MAG: carboxylesterase family protein, partial [Verrucomicrobiota bacterium]|nr:carboxylesterase family protein [Verrucomicrobiota bacterium]